jgi:cell division protein FtsL
MFRITTIFLCVLFLAAVAGRYSAEESVRAAQEELERLDAEYAEEARKVQMLRAEVAYLESPDRLAKIARATTDLRPPVAEEMLSAREFRSAMAGEEAAPAQEMETPPLDDAIITNAIAMAQLARGE